ncbi:MAG: hypothetical protein U9P50_00425 [Patescibacteria group bacterium]|nr:hypothetical protein [Patescibacteria group bacterium]
MGKKEGTLEIRCSECGKKHDVPFSQIFNKGYHKKLFFAEGIICPECKGADSTGGK